MGMSRSNFSNDEIVVAWQSFSVDIEEGGRIRPYDLQRGARVRGDHPGVRTNPQNFVADGTPENEWPSHFAAADVSLTKLAKEQQVERARREPARIPDAEQLEVVIGFSSGGVAHSQGAIVSRNDPKLKKMLAEHPEFFAIPRRPFVP